jgi:hypothetical protein
VWSNIHFHVKQYAKQVQHIKQLLDMLLTVGHELDIICIQDVWHMHTPHHWPSTRHLLLQQLM